MNDNNEFRRELRETFENYEREDFPNNSRDNNVQKVILLVGPSKSGKTTLRNVLQNPAYEPPDLLLAAQPNTEAECDKDVLISTWNLTITMVEIPERMIDGQSSPSEINSVFSHHKIPHIDLICFCVSFDAGIDGKSLPALTRLIDHFNREKIRSNLCLIFTRFESKNKEQQLKRLDELGQDANWSPILPFIGCGIHFTGALKPDDLLKCAHDALRNQFDAIYDYRNNLLQLIQSAEKPFNIRVQPSGGSQRDVAATTISPIPQSRLISQTPIASDSGSQNQKQMQPTHEPPATTGTALIPESRQTTFWPKHLPRCCCSIICAVLRLYRLFRPMYIYLKRVLQCTATCLFHLVLSGIFLCVLLLTIPFYLIILFPEARRFLGGTFQAVLRYFRDNRPME